MRQSERIWTNSRSQGIISLILRCGVIISAAVALSGGVFYLVHYGGNEPAYHIFRGEPTDLRTVSGILRDALLLRSRGIIQLGILLLITTSVIRVVFSVVAFLLQRDYTYALVTVIVLVMLIYGLTGGGL